MVRNFEFECVLVFAFYFFHVKSATTKKIGLGGVIYKTESFFSHDSNI